MRQRERFFFAFVIFILMSAVILMLSLGGRLKFISSLLEKRASQIQGITFSIFHKLPFISENPKTQKAREKNLDLTNQLLEIEKLKKENSALLDQFQTTKPKSYNLIPAHIVGAPDFIPNVTTPTSFILDKGIEDKVKMGQAVIFKNNLIGKIIQTSSSLARVEIVVNNSASFTAKSANGAIGIIRGTGKGMILDNVLLTENLNINDIITTKGDADLKGIGYPPDLVVGKIKSIDKNPTSLFQKAKVESLLDFNKLLMVFIVAGFE